MNNPPAFQFYPQDFLSDLNVRSMSLEEIGIYTLALCHCWIENGLPNDSRVVEGWFNQHPSVARCFYEKDGKFRNKRLDLERQKQIIWREKSAAGGRKSHTIKGNKKGGSRVVKPPLKDPLSLQSSSSSSIKEESRDSSIKVGKPDPLFETLWKSWPLIGRAKKTRCAAKFNALFKKGKFSEFQKVTQGYFIFLNWQEREKGFAQNAMHLATWLNNWEGEKERYLDKNGNVLKPEPRL
jgi:uncharacterized protein YdaU (DUF1376 family)